MPEWFKWECKSLQERRRGRWVDEIKKICEVRGIKVAQNRDRAVSDDDDDDTKVNSFLGSIYISIHTYIPKLTKIKQTLRGEIRVLSSSSILHRAIWRLLLRVVLGGSYACTSEALSFFPVVWVPAYRITWMKGQINRVENHDSCVWRVRPSSRAISWGSRGPERDSFPPPPPWRVVGSRDLSHCFEIRQGRS